jgi:hypothetical protein
MKGKYGTVTVGDRRNGQVERTFNVPPPVVEAVDLCKRIDELRARLEGQLESLRRERERIARRVADGVSGTDTELDAHLLQRALERAVGESRASGPERTGRDLARVRAQLGRLEPRFALALRAHHCTLRDRLAGASGSALPELAAQLRWLQAFGGRVAAELRRAPRGVVAPACMASVAR